LKNLVVVTSYHKINVFIHNLQTCNYIVTEIVEIINLIGSNNYVK